MDKLAGKLTWERTAAGIRVQIPGWMGWRTLFFCGWLAFWTYGGFQAMKSWMTQHNSFLVLWLGFWIVGEVLVASTIFWSFLGTILISLDPTELTISWRVAGTELRRIAICTTDMRNLRYRPLGRGRRTQSAICFETGDKTRCFGTGLSDIEAFALIDKMLEVYPFPKDRALEYLDLSR